ncbi:MAG: sarcosine oxidase subunit gamma [Pseudorhodobacter sp.]
MPDLVPLTALGGIAARKLVHGPLTLEEDPALALASLALRRGAARPAPFDLVLPEPGGWTRQGGIAAFWTGPDQWMIEAPGRAETDFAAGIAAQAPGCSITEQTDGFAAFEITSSEGEAPIHAVMEKLVNIDPARFLPGSATRTGLEHMTVFVIRRATDRLAVLGMRSAAGSVWHALENVVSRLPVSRA